jgi:hypothetical protein
MPTFSRSLLGESYGIRNHPAFGVDVTNHAVAWPTGGAVKNAAARTGAAWGGVVVPVYADEHQVRLWNPETLESQVSSRLESNMTAHVILGPDDYVTAMQNNFVLLLRRSDLETVAQIPVKDRFSGASVYSSKNGRVQYLQNINGAVVVDFSDLEALHDLEAQRMPRENGKWMDPMARARWLVREGLTGADTDFVDPKTTMDAEPDMADVAALWDKHDYHVAAETVQKVKVLAPGSRALILKKLQELEAAGR